jgi:uncharacterized protein YcaQ
MMGRTWTKAQRAAHSKKIKEAWAKANMGNKETRREELIKELFKGSNEGCLSVL